MTAKSELIDTLYSAHAPENHECDMDIIQSISREQLIYLRFELGRRAASLLLLIDCIDTELEKRPL